MPLSLHELIYSTSNNKNNNNNDNDNDNDNNHDENNDSSRAPQPSGAAPPPPVSSRRSPWQRNDRPPAPTLPRRNEHGGDPGGPRSSTPRAMKRQRAETSVDHNRNNEVALAGAAAILTRSPQKRNNHRPPKGITTNAEAPFVESVYGEKKTEGADEMARFDLLYGKVLPDLVESSSNSNGNRRRKRQFLSQIPIVYPASQQRSQRSEVVVRRARVLEWQAIRNRWKQRKYDFRHEPDVGGAIRTQIECSRAIAIAQQQQQQRHEQKKRRHSQKRHGAATTVAAPIKSNDDRNQPGQALRGLDDDKDTSDEEQEAILSQLLQPSQELDAQRAAAAEKLDDDRPLKPYVATLSPWEYGCHPPVLPLPPLLVKTLPPVLSKPTAKAARVKAAQGPRTSQKDAVFTVRGWAVNKVWRPYTYQAEFPIHRGFIAGPALVQRRQIVRAAARHMVGTAGLDGATDARCIRALWKVSHRQLFAGERQRLLPPRSTDHSSDNNTNDNNHGRSFYRVPDWSSPVLLNNYHCRRLGQFLEAFVTHHWKDRQAAAEHLGLLPSQQLVGSDLFIGYSVASTNAQRFTRLLEKFTQEQSLGPVIQDFNTGVSFNSTDHLSDNDNGYAKVAGNDEPSADVFRLPPAGKALWTPNTMYIPLPGTVPPIPSFPLDVTNIIFGPTDRFEHVMHTGAIDESVYKLTLSSLLSRMTAARAVNSDDLATTLQTQLHSILKQIVKLNQSKLHKRLRMHLQMVDLEVPLAYFYKAMMEYCSFVANGVPLPIDGSSYKDSSTSANGMKNQFCFWNSNGDDSGDEDEKENANRSNLRVVVDHLCDFLDEHIEHNGLKMFTRLHVTFGILRISRILPASGIEILSRPLHHKVDRTPFELMRTLLEHLEDSGSLVDTIATNDDRSVINTGELEYTLYRASIVFTECVKREPTDVSNHCWHLSCLAASLLLCSGNRIGSVARMNPSRFNGSVDPHMFTSMNGQRDSPEIRQHEVRRVLPKFNDIRQETANAFRLLVHLAKYQRGNRAPLAVSSFLEWRQVIALMVGPTGATLDTYRDICSLHEHYTNQWVLQESTASARHIWQVRGQSDFDHRLQGLASTLETNPVLESWTALVHALGPVGNRMTETERGFCEQAKCKLCARLTAGLNVAHASLKNRHDSGDWWGIGRCDWWYECLLQQPVIVPVILDDEDVESIHTALVDALRDLEPISLASSEATSPKAFDHDGSLGWLEDAAIHNSLVSDDGKLRWEESSILAIDDYLPQTFLEQSNLSPDVNVTNLLLELSGSDASYFELLSYKALIICHLFSVSHQGVDACLARLINEAWDEESCQLREDSNSFLCLCWLYQMGLNVPVIFLQTQSQNMEAIKQKYKSLSRVVS